MPSPIRSRYDIANDQYVLSVTQKDGTILEVRLQHSRALNALDDAANLGEAWHFDVTGTPNVTIHPKL